MSDKIREIAEETIIHDLVDLHHYRTKKDNCQFCTLAKIEIDKFLSALRSELVKMVGDDRVHSQLCKNSIGNSYGKDGNLEKNCGCIAYGYNLRGKEILNRIEKEMG